MNTNKYKHHLSIKTWAKEERPREKMLLQGKAALTDAELIATLLGTGSIDENAIQLSQRILETVNYNLSELGRLNVTEFKKFKGIGEAKAITLIAALELGRRRQFSDLTQRDVITCASDAYNALLPSLIDLPHEEFWVILLNRANKIIGKYCISRGGVTGTVVDAKIVFKAAIEALATGIILAHNHPSGQLQPSQQDIDLTRKLRKAGENLDIAVLDHIIISRTGFYSFNDHNLL